MDEIVKTEKPKKECPKCHQMFVNVGSHMAHAHVKKVRAKRKTTTAPRKRKLATPVVAQPKVLVLMPLDAAMKLLHNGTATLLGA